MINTEDYFEQRDRFRQICEAYKNIPFGSIYRTTLKIAAKRWVDFVNHTLTDGYRDVKIVQGTGGIAIKQGDKFIINERLVKKWVNISHSGTYHDFSCMYHKCTLDELELKLNNRK